MAKQKTPRAQLGNARIEKYYNKIVALFVGLTVILLALIVYFSFSKTTLLVHVKELTMPVTAKMTVADLGGTVLLTTVEGSKSAAPADTSVATPGKAAGTVTMINTHNQSQGLIATTRLLSTEGVLFRTQETVTVPAGGSVDVDVIADQEGPDGNISASKFEIVALWPGLQEKIYGTSATAMSGGVTYSTKITAEEIQQLKTGLTNELLAQAEGMFREELTKRSALPTDAWIPTGAMTIVETVVNDVNAEAGDVASELTATQKLTIATVVLSANTALQKATTEVGVATEKEKLAGLALARALIVDDLTLVLVKLHDDQVSGDLTLSVDAPLAIRADHELLDTKRLTGKTKSEIEALFAGADEIESVEVRFSPFWVKKTPTFPENISVVIE